MSVLSTFLKLIKPAPVEKFSLSVFNANLDAIDTAIAKLPRGAMMRRNRNALSGFMTNNNLDTVNNVTLKGGRIYKFTYDSVNQTNTADTVFLIGLHKAPTTDDPASVTNMTPLGLKNYAQGNYKAAGVNESTFLEVIIPQETDETIQMKITYQKLAGAGAVACVAMNWVLEDIGAIV